MEGMLLLAEQTENKHMKSALTEIYKLMEQGRTFSDAIKDFPQVFTPYLISMVKIGESSGTLDTTFSRLTGYFTKEAEIRKKLRAALTYPAILAIMMTGIVLLLILRILPMFSNILSGMGSDIPAVTAALLQFSQFFSQYFIVIAAVILLIVLLIIFLPRFGVGRTQFDKFKVTMPLAKGVNTKVITARFARSLSILLRSGVQLLNALDEVVPLVDNRYLQGMYLKAIDQVRNGDELSDALERMGIFPLMFLRMLIIGQKTGLIDEMLEKSADLFEEDVYDSIERMTALLEPILIIILSVIVGVILISVMLPMIGIMNAIG